MRENPVERTKYTNFLSRNHAFQRRPDDFLSQQSTIPPNGRGASPLYDPWQRLGLELGSCGNLRSRQASLEHYNRDPEPSNLVRGLSLDSVSTTYSQYNKYAPNPQNAPQFQNDPNVPYRPYPRNIPHVSHHYVLPEALQQTWSIHDSTPSPVNETRGYDYHPYNDNNNNKSESFDQEHPVKLDLSLVRRPSYDDWPEEDRDRNQNSDGWFHEARGSEHNNKNKGNNQIPWASCSSIDIPEKRARLFSENDDLKTRIKKLVHGKDARYHPSSQHIDNPTKHSPSPSPQIEQVSPLPNLDRQYDQWRTAQTPNKLSLAWSPLEFLDGDPLIGAPLTPRQTSAKNLWEEKDVDSRFHDLTQVPAKVKDRDYSQTFHHKTGQPLFEPRTFSRGARPRFKSDDTNSGTGAGARNYATPLISNKSRTAKHSPHHNLNKTPPRLGRTYSLRRVERPRFYSDNTNAGSVADPVIQDRNHTSRAPFKHTGEETQPRVRMAPHTYTKEEDRQDSFLNDLYGKGSTFDRNSRRTTIARFDKPSSSPKRNAHSKSNFDPRTWHEDEHVSLNDDIQSLTHSLKKGLRSLQYQDDVRNINHDREYPHFELPNEDRSTSPRFNINSFVPKKADIPRYSNKVKTSYHKSSPVVFPASYHPEDDSTEVKFISGSLTLDRNENQAHRLAKLGPNRIIGSDFEAGRFKCSPVREERRKAVYLECPDSDSSDPSEDKTATIITFRSDVARMTDDLAMDLDLDGPEKNVYVVNPQKPVNFNAPRGLEAAPPPAMGYGTPPAVPSPPSSRPYQSPRQYSPRQEPPSPGIINDTPSAADIMKKWQQRERQTKPTRQTDRPTIKPRTQHYTPSTRHQVSSPTDRLTDRRSSLEKILANRRVKLDKLERQLSDLDRSNMSRRSSTDSRTRSSERRSSQDTPYSCDSDSSSRRSNRLYSSERRPSNRSSTRRPILETCGTLPEPPPRGASLDQIKSRHLQRNNSMDTFITNLDQLQEDLSRIRPKPREHSTPRRTNRPTNTSSAVSSNHSNNLKRENSFKIAREIIQKYR